MMRPDRKRNRLSGYDYSLNALYFVTLCVQNKACVFGQVLGDEVQLNEFGRIAVRQWVWLAEQYPYIQLHDFVVMPNHVHGILEINSEHFFGKIKSLSELMGAYKTTSSKQIRLAGLHEFAWHRSFHDHIIRHERAYNNIKHYILNNPTTWPKDTFHQP